MRSTTHRLALGFGTLLALSACSAVLTAYFTSKASNDLHLLARVEWKTSESFFEMEINVAETGLAVLKYLETKDVAFRRRVDADAGEFDAAAARFERVSREAEDQRLVALTRDLYKEYRALGESLMEERDRNDILSRSVLRAFEGLATSLNGVVELKVLERDLMGLAARFSIPILLEPADVDPRPYLDRIQAFRLTEEEKRSLPRFEEDLRVLSGHFREAVKASDVHRSGIARFVALRGQLDRVIDGDIQVRARERRQTATSDAEASIRRARVILLASTIVVCALALLAALWIGRRVATPIRDLVEGARAITSGRLDYRIPPGASDDIGLLIRDFNDMAASRQKAEENLRSQSSMLQSILDSMSDGVAVADPEGRFVLFNAPGERILGIGAVADAPLEWTRSYGCYLPDETTPFPAHEIPLVRALRGESCDQVEIFLRNAKIPAGTHISVSARPWTDASGTRKGGIAVFRDITELRRTREELKVMNANLEGLVRERSKALEKSEAQLRQAQKLEAIGRLAGGVAHDFNNVLSVVMGYSNLLLSGKGPQDPERESVEEIAKAAERATGLTRQLLTFSRKQIVMAQVVDLNDSVRGIERMLKRLIRENVQLTTRLHEGAVRAKIDPGQFEQILMNLAVNARDAMPDGGKLLLETALVEEGVDGEPGRFALVAATDTGCGMDKETQSHLFEPFFTTKGAGKGTGLGLSTVYGIVKQAGGFIRVYSEVGKGSTFKVYLPEVEKAVTAVRRRLEKPSPKRGSETVLIVEDSESVRKLAVAILRGRGYQVHEARNGEEAIEVAAALPGEIHLLLTDSLMPGISGRQLSERMKVLRPGTKVLLVSGYTEEGAQLQGELERGMAFLEKPFTPDSLAAKVREILGTAEPAPDVGSN